MEKNDDSVLAHGDDDAVVVDEWDESDVADAAANADELADV